MEKSVRGKYKRKSKQFMAKKKTSYQILVIQLTIYFGRKFFVVGLK